MKNNRKEWVIRLGFWAFGIIISLIFLFKCGNTNTINLNLESQKDSLNIEFNNLKAEKEYFKQLALKKDSAICELKKQKPEIKTVYVKGRVSIVENICDTVKVLAAYDSLNIQCERVNSVNNNIIEQQDEFINILKDEVKVTEKEVLNRQAIINLNLIELELEQQNNKATKKKLRQQKAKTLSVGLMGILSTCFAILPLIK